MNFSKTLILWYLENKRELPWRDTTNPYLVWLSEIILQQTRVAQGKPYYLKFANRFPDVFELANASEEEILKLWQGLGYYSRARNLHKAAKYIAFELSGEFPNSKKELLKLKGVGEYTASAIASFCFKEPVAVVDGNVFRVLSRIFGISTPINTTEGITEFKELAGKLLDQKNPATHNQAIMEFGALQCTPKLPKCGSCPFASTCIAYNQNLIQQLPVKLKKQKIRKRHFNYLVFISDSRKTILQQRKGKGIWQNLYEFPLVETNAEVSVDNLVKEENFSSYSELKTTEISLFNDKPVVHKLSHQHLYTKFWILHCEELPEKGIPLQEIGDFPVPALIDKFMQAFGL